MSFQSGAGCLLPLLDGFLIEILGNCPVSESQSMLGLWYIPPTRARESLGLPSPRDFPRAKPEGNPEGKANPDSPELLLEVYHSLLLYMRAISG